MVPPGLAQNSDDPILEVRVCASYGLTGSGSQDARSADPQRGSISSVTDSPRKSRGIVWGILPLPSTNAGAYAIDLRGELGLLQSLEFVECSYEPVNILLLQV